MEIGYARVSTIDQNLDAQLDALNKAGCEKIFQDKVSGVRENRPGLVKLMDTLKEGDTLIVWKLDRLGRSLINLIAIVNVLAERGVRFKSLQENIDTSTSSGKLTFHIFSSLAEFERDLIRDRTKAGLAAARERGRIGGRKNTLNIEQIKQLREMYSDCNNSVRNICDKFNICKATLYNYLKSAN